MSDPDRNYYFRRRWDAPPSKVKRRPMGGTIGSAGHEVSSSDENLEHVFAKFKHLVEVER